MNVEAPARRKTPAAPIGDDPRPIVALPNPGLPGLAIAVVAAIVAVLLFLILDGQRKRSASESAPSEYTPAGAFAPPPPLVIPPEPAPAPPPVVTIPVLPQPTPAPQPQPRVSAPAPAPMPMISPVAPPVVVPPSTMQPAPKLTEPALVFDAGRPGGGEVGNGPPTPTAATAAATGANAPGASRAQPPARPTRIANPTTVVPTGTLIRAVLETPIDTSRPGLARAIVSKDTRGFDGQRVLVPRGSRLVGEYESDVRTGQNKVLVNWTQLIRPDGTAIRLDSPATDAMGGAGVPGRVNTFFFQRFFNAVLQTALTVGTSLATWSSDAPVVIGLPNGAVTNVAGQGGSLLGQVPQPRIRVKQGTAFNVFVARDLDFTGAPLRK